MGWRFRIRGKVSLLNGSDKDSSVKFRIDSPDPTPIAYVEGSAFVGGVEGIETCRDYSEMSGLSLQKLLFKRWHQ